jgi:hypothetical protein
MSDGRLEMRGNFLVRSGCMPMARSLHSCKESQGSSWAGLGLDLWSCKYVFLWHRRQCNFSG